MPAATTRQVSMIPTVQIVAGANDRTAFDPIRLRELADSIQAIGLAQPITVRRLPDTDLYQIAAGERRFRACCLLGWQSIPALVADLSDAEAAAIMLAENMGRQDLDPIEEARAYSARVNGLGWSVEDCARQAGASTNRILGRLKLLALTEDVQELVRSGNLSLGYAQSMAGAQLDPNRQILALGKLRDNPSPTPQWWRRLCVRLSEEQAQECLFGEEEFRLEGEPAPSAIPQTEPVEIAPAEPGFTVPPAIGRTPAEVLACQAGFWEKAAEQWDSLGKGTQRENCTAAAVALHMALAAISAL